MRQIRCQPHGGPRGWKGLNEWIGLKETLQETMGLNGSYLGYPAILLQHTSIISEIERLRVIRDQVTSLGCLCGPLNGLVC